MFLGDVLLWIAGLVGFFLTTWATILACSLLFESRTFIARQELESNPGRTFFRGVLLVATIGVVATVLVGQPLPLVKVIGFAIYAWMLAVAAIGVSGISLLISERIRLRQDLPEFTAQSRAAAITVGIGLVPLAGWLLFAPAVFIFGLGSGWKACVPAIRTLRKRSHATTDAA